MTYDCTEPDCDRSFEKELGLRMHHQRVHGGMGPGFTHDRVNCPECGKPVSESFIKRHMVMYHTKEGELVPVPPTPKKRRKQAANNDGSLNVSFKALPMVVLEDGSGGLWIAERIR